MAVAQMKVELKKCELVPVIRQHGISNDNLADYILRFILQNHHIKAVDPISEGEAIQKINSFLKLFKNYYKECSRNYTFLLEKRKDWLETNLEIYVNIPPMQKCGTVYPGRPSVSYSEASERTKRRKISSLTHMSPKLLAASASKTTKDPAFAFVMKEATLSPNRPAKMKKMITAKPLVSCTNEETLAEIVNSSMSYKAYNSWKKFLKLHGANILPSQKEISIAKTLCYPAQITITETSAECELRSILSHTTSRLLIVAENKIKVILQKRPLADLKGKLFCKWGFDGASSQKIYKQQYNIADFEECILHEECLFSTCLVPLRLEIAEEIIWENEVPSSILFCRPIRLQYETETSDVCQKEKVYIESKIREIVATTHGIYFEELNTQVEINIEYDLSLTMLDGKAINAIANVKSTQRCNLCLASPSEMNDIDNLLTKEIVNPEALEYGLSNLHCWIRFFEYILHIGYKLGIKKWMARTEEEKNNVKTRKDQIGVEFRKRLHLIVDRPKVGTGNTNDGNTSRRAFQNSKIFSEITGVDKKIIDMFHSILQVLNCHEEIDTEKFETFCVQAARTAVNLYPWYKIPASVHKLLLHGSLVIKNHLLPIGSYSEECLESLHKIVRNTRLQHTRKTSRKNTMQDQFHHLLIASDPVISTLRKKQTMSQARKLTAEARSLLKHQFDIEDLSISDTASDSDEESVEEEIL